MCPSRPKTLEHVVTRSRRLDEQRREKPDGSSRLGEYVRRWVRWITDGVNTRSWMQLTLDTLDASRHHVLSLCMTLDQPGLVLKVGGLCTLTLRLYLYRRAGLMREPSQAKPLR